MGGFVNYWRVAIFSLVVLSASLLPAVALACMLGWKPLLFGHIPEQSRANFHLVEYMATGVTAALAYAWLLLPVTRRLVAHVLIVFLLVEVIQSLAGLVLGDSLADSFVWQAFAVDALYAAVGLSLVTGWRFVRARKAA